MNKIYKLLSLVFIASSMHKAVYSMDLDKYMEPSALGYTVIDIEESQEKDLKPCISRKKLIKNLYNFVSVGATIPTALLFNYYMPGSAASVFAFTAFGTGTKSALVEIKYRTKLPIAMLITFGCYWLDYYTSQELGIPNAGFFSLGLLCTLSLIKKGMKDCSKSLRQDKNSKIDEEEDDQDELKGFSEILQKIKSLEEKVEKLEAK